MRGPEKEGRELFATVSHSVKPGGKRNFFRGGTFSYETQAHGFGALCAPREHMGSNSTKLMPQKTIGVI